MKDNSQRKLRFIFINCCMNARFFDPLKKGMQDAADMMNAECTYTGTGGVDAPVQAECIHDAIKNEYDGIALNILNAAAFAPAIKEAADAGIPVAAFNIDDRTVPTERICGISQNFSVAGKTLAEYILPEIPDRSHVLLTMHDAGISALEQRRDGIAEALSGKNVRITEFIPGNNALAGTEALKTILDQNKDIAFVIGTGQADTEAAGRVIEKYFADTNLRAAGFDLSQKTLELIESGIILCTVDQQPYIQGFYPVVQLAHFIRYGIVPSDIDAGAAIINKGNVRKVMALTEQYYR